jgi:hypothetical protein
MAPMVHGLEAKYFGKIIFSYLDADDPLTFDIQQTLGFYYQPEIYFLDPNGVVIQKWVGYTSEPDLESAFLQFVQ